MSVTVDMNFDGFQREFGREVGNLVQKVAYVFRGEIQQLLTKSGKSSKRPPHNYSVAGQVPHNMTGTLARSWRASKVKKKGSKYSASVGTSTVYAAALEFGYVPRNLARRPYIQKSIKKARPRIKKMVNVPAMTARAAARAGA